MTRSAKLGILGLLCLVLPANARADWEYTRWTMTPAEVVRASGGTARMVPPAERRRIEEAKLEYAAEGSLADGPLRLRVRFSFDTRSGKLACVAYAVTSEAQNDLLRTWLVERYGPPTSEGGLPVIGMRTLGWKNPDEIDLTITQGEPAFVLHCAPPGVRP
jgi:hypothetical protein